MPQVLNFLRLSGTSNEKELAVIDKSVEFAKSNKIDVHLISDASEVKRLIADSTQPDTSIYVCLPFEGKIFEKLKEKGYRIIGPQCVLSCLLLEIPVPKQTYPVCNVAMLDTVVCCSSMKKDERLAIQDLVLAMGGTVTGAFITSVTHLIAKEVGSKKYEVACSNKITVVFPSWVYSVWGSSKYDHIIASDYDVVKEHLIPIFKGCTICVTGIDATKRDAIKTIVTKNGGVYSGELNMKTCTHLLCEHPSGQKYAHARQWKLHCVSPAWLYDCLKKKHWLDEKAYIIEADSNTTLHNNTLQNMTIQNTMLTSNTSRMSSVAAEVAAKSRVLSNASKPSVDKNNDLNFKLIPSHSININNIKYGRSAASYLDECKIYVCNHPGNIYDACKKIINDGGGIRSNTLTESITHIVCWEEVQAEVTTFLNKVKESGEGAVPHVVSPLWLIESCKAGALLAEEAYSLLIVESKTCDDDVFEKPKLPTSKAHITPSLQMQFEEDINDESTLLNQYLSVNHESTRISQLEDMTGKKEKPNLEDVTQDDDATVTLDVDDANVLLKKNFLISRFGAKEAVAIQNLIEEYGGKVVESKECDYIIVPLSYEKEIKIDEREVTLCWLEQSIEQQELIDPKSSYIFLPVQIPPNVQPLQNCVVTISQYSGLERQHLFHLAELLGGIGQEYFVRKDTDKLKASTHLILSKPEGSKYDASIKWNIPCVDKDWLFRCAQTKRRLPEHAFSMSTATGKEVDVVTNIEETNAHAWETGSNAATHPVTEEVSSVAEKSIIACPPDLTDHISLDFSTRGASLMENTTRNDGGACGETKKDDRDSDQAKEDGEGRDATNKDGDNGVEATEDGGDCDETNGDHRDGGEEDKVEDDDETRELSEEDTSISVIQAVDKNNSLYNNPDNQEKSLLKENSLNTNTKKTTRPDTDFSNFNAFITNEKKDSLMEDIIDKENVNNISAVSSTAPHDFSRSRFSFDFTDALDGFQSPAVSSQDSRRKSSMRRSRASLPFDMQFTAALQRAAKNVGVDENVFDDTDAEVEGNDDGSTESNTKDSGILCGVVVLVSKKLCHSQSELHNLTAALGGDVRFMYDDTCTHFIHQGKTNDTSKDYAQAKKGKKHLVSPHWLQACLDANSKVDESKYPVTYNPRMSIDVMSDRPTRSKPQTDAKASSSGTDEPDIEGYRNVERDTKGKKDGEVGLKSPSALDVQKKMEEIMNAAKAPQKERRNRRQTNTSANKSDCNRKMRNRTSSQKNDSGHSSNSDPLVAKPFGVACINEQSQGAIITYDDPTGRLERERILEHLKRASPSQDIESLCYPVEKLGGRVCDASKENGEGNEAVEENENNTTQNEDEPKKSLSPYQPQISVPITTACAVPEVVDLLYDDEADNEVKKMENSRNYKFLFSGMTGQEKIDYGATIEQLGGVLFDVQYFNMQATHLIVKAPSKNEKYLSALASGRWTLHKSFLDASREANDFVDESQHEWGSQYNANEMAIAARRWRVDLAEERRREGRAGAFSGWVVLLCIEPSKQAGFKRILEAGGAKLLAVRPPFDNIEGATHAFIGDKKQLTKAQLDLQQLHDAGVWILKPEYIADYLILHPKPPTFDYVLEEVNEQTHNQSQQRKRKATENSKTKQTQKRSKR